MKKYLLFTFLIIINLYTPYTLWIATIVNLFFALFTLKQIKQTPRFDFFVIFISIIILLWCILVSFVNDNLSAYVIGRHARIVFNAILLSLIVRNTKILPSLFLKSIGIALFVNVICVYIQTLFPVSKEFFLSITEYTKEIQNIRAFGLYSSYDACGLNICFGMCFWGILYYYKKKAKYLLLLSITFLSAIFISRTTIVVASVFFVIFISISFKVQKVSYRILTIALASFVFFLFYETAIKLLSYNSDDYVDYAGGSYTKHSFDVLTGRMLFLPQSVFSTIIGEGIDQKRSDIGYIKQIFMIGLIGVAMILCWYRYGILHLKKEIKDNSPISIDSLIIYKVILILFLLMLIFNFKLLLLFGRGFNDLYIILIFALNKFLQEKYVQTLK